MGAREAVLRLIALTRRELADLASGQRSASRSRWTSRMLDRIGLMLPRLSSAGEIDQLEPWRELRMGLSIIDVRNAEPQLDEAGRKQMQRLCAKLAEHLRVGSDQAVAASLLEEIRDAAEQTGRIPGLALRRDTALALVSLYRNLLRTAQS